MQGNRAQDPLQEIGFFRAAARAAVGLRLKAKVARSLFIGML